MGCSASSRFAGRRSSGARPGPRRMPSGLLDVERALRERVRRLGRGLRPLASRSAPCAAGLGGPVLVGEPVRGRGRSGGGGELDAVRRGGRILVGSRATGRSVRGWWRWSRADPSLTGDRRPRRRAVAHAGEHPGDRVRLVGDRCHGPIPAPDVDPRARPESPCGQGIPMPQLWTESGFQRGLRRFRDGPPRPPQPPPNRSPTAAPQRREPLKPHGLMPLLFESQEDVHMPSKIRDPAVKVRALRMVADHRGDYPSDTACGRGDRGEGRCRAGNGASADAAGLLQRGTGLARPVMSRPRSKG